MWIIITLLGIVSLADAASLMCFGYSTDIYDEAELYEVTKILKSPYYNNSCSCHNLILTFGFCGDPNGPTMKYAIEAMIRFKKERTESGYGCVNVFLLNWVKEASCTDVFGEIGIKLWYAKTVPLAMAVGVELGKALLIMSDNGLCLNNTHLAGLSLGAHLLCYAGRYVNANGNGITVDRLTALDAAGPGFETEILMPVDKSCANFVVTIPTDPGGLGVNASRGHINIWPNYFTKKGQVQPGCPVGNFKYLSKEAICSHEFATRYWADALNLNNSLSSYAPDFWTWAAGISSLIITLGEDINRSARGDFYCTTNAAPPYGKGMDGLHP